MCNDDNMNRAAGQSFPYKLHSSTSVLQDHRLPSGNGNLHSSLQELLGSTGVMGQLQSTFLQISSPQNELTMWILIELPNSVQQA